MNSSAIDLRPAPLAGLSYGHLEALKWFAVACMLQEHFFRFVVGTLPQWSYAIGRMTFPLFGFALVLSIVYGAPWRRLLPRLLLWAVIAQLAQLLVRPFLPLSVLFTLAAGAAAIYVARDTRGLSRWGVVALVSLATVLCEFGGYGVLAMVAAFYGVKRRDGVLLFLAMCLVCASNGDLWAWAAVVWLGLVEWLDLQFPRVRHVFYRIYALQFPVLWLVGSLVGTAQAAGTCYQWAAPSYLTMPQVWVEAPPAAAQQRADFCTSGNTNCGASPVINCGPAPTQSTCVTTVQSLTPGTWPAFNVVYAVVGTNNTSGAVTNATTSSLSLLSRQNPEGCPECPPQGTEKVLGFSAANAPNGGQACVSGCGFDYGVSTLTISASGSGQLLVGRSTGKACGQTAVVEQQADNSDCMNVGGVGYVCADTGTNCGEVNGDRVCVSAIPPNGCVSYQSGGVACVSTAGAPPAPDNGTPGTPAPPSVQVSQNSTTINYFTSTTVNNSSAPPTTGPPQSGDPEGSGGGSGGSGGSGECVGGAEECGTGTASGGQLCDAPPTCSGDAIACLALDQQWRARCPTTPSDLELDAALGEGGEPADGNGDGRPDLVGETETELATSLDDGGWISNRCPADISIALGGLLPTVSIPVSNWCNWLSIIGNLVVVAAMLAALKIVGGAF